jgi:hypothetical protein
VLGGAREAPRSAIIATKVSVREFVLEVPADAQDDDLGIEMAPADRSDSRNHLSIFNMRLRSAIASEPNDDP